MIDTIYIRLNLKTLRKNRDYYYDAVRNAIEIDDEGYSYKRDQQYLKGRLENFHVQIRGDDLLLNGSLCVYLWGENVTTLTKEGIDASLKKLERKLGVPVRQGILTRIDIATNLNVKHPPQIYLEALDTVQNCVPYNWRGTKTFRRSRQTITFYDKMAQLAKKHPAVHTRFKDEGNMLRYELTLGTKLDSLVGQGDLRVLWLHSSKFLKRLAELWLDQYEAVIKKPISFVPSVSSAKIFRKYIEYKGLVQEGGLHGIFREIDIYSKSNNWTKNAGSKLKREYRNLYVDERFSEVSPVVTELNDLIYNSGGIRHFLRP